MTTAPAIINTTHWPTLEEAARKLETSVRTMWRHIERGEIEVRKRPVPGRKPANVVNPRDVDKLRPKPFVMPARAPDEPTAIVPVAPAPVDRGAMAEIAAAMNSLALAVVTTSPAAQPAVAIDKKLWLTLDEAAAYSGWARGKLRAAIAHDRLASRRNGPHGATVINRVDLERFCSV